MFENLEILRTANALASHAGARQAVVAENIANADTPDFRAKDMADFAEVYNAPLQTTLRTSRVGHIAGDAVRQDQVIYDSAVSASPNGNSVSIESEMVKATDLRQQHDMALSVYRASTDILRASLGRIR